MSGEIPPPIKVVDRVLCDGHHRYIAGLIYGEEPDTIPWALPTNYIVRKWQDIEVDLEMWHFD